VCPSCHHQRQLHQHRVRRLTILQALKAQLDRVVSSQPMKRQESAADAEVSIGICRIRARSVVPTLRQMRGLRRQLKQLQVSFCDRVVSRAWQRLPTESESASVRLLNSLLQALESAKGLLSSEQASSIRRTLWHECSHDMLQVKQLGGKRHLQVFFSRPRLYACAWASVSACAGAAGADGDRSEGLVLRSCKPWSALFCMDYSATFLQVPVSDRT
jgi:hypothetical protein